MTTISHHSSSSCGSKGHSSIGIVVVVLVATAAAGIDQLCHQYNGLKVLIRRFRDFEWKDMSNNKGNDKVFTVGLRLQSCKVHK
jgi:hypothetical protein